MIERLNPGSILWLVGNIGTAPPSELRSGCRTWVTGVLFATVCLSGTSDRIGGEGVCDGVTSKQNPGKVG